MELVPRKKTSYMPGQLHFRSGVTRSSSQVLLQTEDLIKVVYGGTDSKNYFEIQLFTTLGPRIEGTVVFTEWLRIYLRFRKENMTTNCKQA
jgi:hypothetical protein